MLHFKGRAGHVQDDACDGRSQTADCCVDCPLMADDAVCCHNLADRHRDRMLGYNMGLSSDAAISAMAAHVSTFTDLPP